MKTIKNLAAIFIVIVATNILGQEHKHDMYSKMEMEKDTIKTKNIVHEGIINLKAIDKNKDSKVYQDQMDWNVISDKAGKCPLCGMVLKEVTLNKAKENLKKHGFEVK